MKDYKRFLNVCIHLIELSPWDYLTSDEFCQIIIEEFKFPVLVSVLGSGKIAYGFLITTNPVQSSYLLTLLDDINESSLSRYRREQYFMVTFEFYKNIIQKDRKILREYFGKLDNQSVYPILKKSSWEKDIEDPTDDEFTNICIILENLYMLLKSILENNTSKENHIIGVDFPLRFYSPETKLYNNGYMPLLKELYSPVPYFLLNENNVSKLSSRPFNNLIVEYDMLYIPAELESKNTALVYVLYDVKSDLILDMEVIDSDSDRALLFVIKYLDSILEFGFFKEVRCRDRIDKRILDSLKIPKKPKTLVKPLKNTDIIIDELIKENVR